MFANWYVGGKWQKTSTETILKGQVLAFLTVKLNPSQRLGA